VYFVYKVVCFDGCCSQLLLCTRLTVDCSGQMFGCHLSELRRRTPQLYMTVFSACAAISYVLIVSTMHVYVSFSSILLSCVYEFSTDSPGRLFLECMSYVYDVRYVFTVAVRFSVYCQ